MRKLPRPTLQAKLKKRFHAYKTNDLGTNKIWITNENAKSVAIKASYAREIGW